MNFYVYKHYPQNISLRNVIVLIRDNWDDWFRFERIVPQTLETNL